uniref:LIM zinc-binding domain-containing protein n=1 Tax=Globodera pallida TaxID=36090 RepID=A0A183BWR9_GLOPA
MNYGATIETDESKLLLPLDPCDVQLKQGHHRPPVTLFNETFGHFVGPEQLLPLVASPNSTDRTASANAEVNAEYASDGANFLGPTNLPNPFDQRIHSGPSGDPQPAFIFTKNLLRVCRGCEMEIHDRHLLCVHRPTHFTIRRGASKGENEYWHEHCLRCCQCEGQLRTGDSCFVRDGRVYCREDHLK